MNSSFKTFFLGSFDGLHIGHKTLLQNVLSPFGVMIMFNIPRKKQFIFPLEERIQQIKQHFQPKNIFLYDVEKNNMSGEKFLEKFLIDKQIETIVVGNNFTFGNDHLPASRLAEACQKLIIKTVDKKISSSQIKQYLTQNNLENANKLLLNCFFYEGIVIHGRAISRTFECPTANFLVADEIIKLFHGSYITVTEINHSFYESITFVGQSKTLTNEPWCVQTHILDKEFNLYNQKIRTYFIKFIRENEKFSSISLLKEKIFSDVQTAKIFFKKNSLQENLVNWKIF